MSLKKSMHSRSLSGSSMTSRIISKTSSRCVCISMAGTRNVALDQELHRLTAKRAALLPLLHDAEAVSASVRDFCERARARLENCHDFESKRHFFTDYVPRVVYTRHKVTVRGSVPIMPKAGVGQDQSSGAATFEFRIEGEIGAMLHGRRSRKFPDDGRLTSWGACRFA